MAVTPVQYAVKQSCIFSFGHIVVEAPTPAAQGTESGAAAQIENNGVSEVIVSQKSVNNMNAIIHNSDKIGREKRASIFHPEWSNNEAAEVETPPKPLILTDYKIDPVNQNRTVWHWPIYEDSGKADGAYQSHMEAIRTDVRQLFDDGFGMQDVKQTDTKVPLRDTFASELANCAGSSRMEPTGGAVQYASDDDGDADSNIMGLRRGAIVEQDADSSRTVIFFAASNENEEDANAKVMGRRGGAFEDEVEGDTASHTMELRGGALQDDTEDDDAFDAMGLRGGSFEDEAEDDTASHTMRLRGGALENEDEDTTNNSGMGLKVGDPEDGENDDTEHITAALKDIALESRSGPAKLVKAVKLSRKEQRRAKARHKAWQEAIEAEKAEAEKLDIVMSDGTVVQMSSQQLFIDSTIGRSKKQKRRDIKEFGKQDKLVEAVSIRGGKPFEIKEGQVCALRRAACKQWRLKNEQMRLEEEAAERAAEKAEKEKEKEQRHMARTRKMRMTRGADGTFRMEPVGPNDADGIDVLLPEKENIMRAIVRSISRNLKDLAPTYSNC